MADSLCEFIATVFDPTQLEPIEVIMGYTLRFDGAKREDEYDFGIRYGFLLPSLAPKSEDMKIEMETQDLMVGFTETQDLLVTFMEDSKPCRPPQDMLVAFTEDPKPCRLPQDLLVAPTEDLKPCRPSQDLLVASMEYPEPSTPPRTPPSRPPIRPPRYNREATKLSELQLVENFRQWRGTGTKKTSFLREDDAHQTHPRVMVKGYSSSYFMAKTRYTPSQRPRRMRITETGCRWRQQGRCYPIKLNGKPIAYKTYLSYVPLKNPLGRYRPIRIPEVFETADILFYLVNDESTEARIMKKSRRRAIWTMEEIILAEDLDKEKELLKKNEKPEPIGMICRILCKQIAPVSK